MKESFGHNKISFDDFVRRKNLGPKTAQLFKQFLQDKCGCDDCVEVNEAKLYRAYDNFREYAVLNNFFYPEDKINLEESMEDFDSKFHRSYKFAKNKHDATGAVRKFSGAPYIVHPDGVAKIVDAYGGDDDQVKAALAHDCLEDTDATYEDIVEYFGKKAANIVKLITNDPEEVKRVGKEKYISNELLHLPHKALLVKLADIMYNFYDHCPESQAARIINNMIALSKRKDLTEPEHDLIDDIMTRVATAI